MRTSPSQSGAAWGFGSPEGWGQDSEKSHIPSQRKETTMTKVPVTTAVNGIHFHRNHREPALRTVSRRVLGRKITSAWSCPATPIPRWRKWSPRLLAPCRLHEWTVRFARVSRSEGRGRAGTPQPEDTQSQGCPNPTQGRPLSKAARARPPCRFAPYAQRRGARHGCRLRRPYPLAVSKQDSTRA